MRIYHANCTFLLLNPYYLANVLFPQPEILHPGKSRNMTCKAGT